MLFLEKIYQKIISLHLICVNYFKQSDTNQEDTIKIEFIVTCSYMWFFQSIYCLSIGMPRFSMICLFAFLLKMSLLVLYKTNQIIFDQVRRYSAIIVIFGINACYLNGNGYLSPSVVWLCAVPVFVITLYGVKDGAWWSLSSVALSILIFEYSYRIGHNINEYNDELTYITMQSNLFIAPLLLYMMFGVRDPHLKSTS